MEEIAVVGLNHGVTCGDGNAVIDNRGGGTERITGIEVPKASHMHSLWPANEN